MSQPAPLITLGIGPGGSVLYTMTGGLDIDTSSEPALTIIATARLQGEIDL